MSEMYKSYGDVNFFDGGILVKEIGENEYDVITCYGNPDEENSYLFTTEQVNITDDWIDKHDVCSYCGLRDYSIDYTDEEKIQLAIGIVQYYGNHCGTPQRFLSKNEIIDEIDRCFINEIEWEYYKNNFFENNRNCVVEIFNNYSQGGKQVYNSLEDALEDFESRAEKDWSLTVIDI